MSVQEIEWVLFDLNGTLLDPRAIARGWSDDRAQEQVAIAALDAAIAQAMADSLVGSFRPFPEYLAAALAHRVPEGRVERALEIAAKMPPFPGARDTLERLATAVRVGVLTNSATASATEALAAADLSGPVSVVIGADEVERYKPHPAVYEHALARLEADASRVMLVAAHWWDVHGAKRAGLRTCWIAHKEERLLETAAAPDLSVGNLRELPPALGVTEPAPVGPRD